MLALTGAGEEGGARLAGHSLGQQGLAGTCRAGKSYHMQVSLDCEGMVIAEAGRMAKQQPIRRTARWQ